MSYVIPQIAIAVFGLLALYLSQSRNDKMRFLAAVAGLCGQPFWLYATFSASAWGMFLVSVGYTVVYASGVYTFWPARKKQADPGPRWTRVR